MYEFIVNFRIPLKLPLLFPDGDHQINAAIRTTKGLEKKKIGWMNPFL